MSNNNRIRGKIIVITGASSGIGQRVALKAAECGAVPVLLARSEDILRDTARSIKEKYDIDSPYYKADVSNIDELQAVFAEIYRSSGTVDILVNNAGFGIFDEVADADLGQMKAMFEVNVFGLVASTKMVLKDMLKKKSGHIINIASIAGKVATPKSSVYSATKHAVLGFTNSLRMEVRDSGIFVTSVNPGPIRTKFFDIADESGTYVKNVQKYMLDPERVAEKIVDAMLTPKREINLPSWMGMGSTFYQLFPGFVEKVAGKSLFKK